MLRLLIVAPETLGRRLAAEMGRYSFTSTIIRPADDVRSLNADAALVASDDAAFDLCRRLKRERRLPVVALVKKADLNDKLAALECDDFVVEPYDAVELGARLGRLLAARGVAETKKVSAEGLVLDAAEAAVYLNGRPVELTFREYELLRYLAEHPGRVFSRDALLNAVWGYDYFGGDRTVDVHIRRLRSKIEDPEHSYIDTVRNMGYRFKKPAE